MTRSFLRLALAVLLLVLAPAHAAGPSIDPAGTVDAFHFALKAGDRRKALELLSPDVVIFEQGHFEKSRAEYAAKHLKEDMDFAAITRRSVARRDVQMSQDMAWVMSVIRTTGKINNRPVDITTNETMLLRREGGRWQIRHIHWSFSSNKGGV
jgi:ketosteroid isomerase-like protein